MNSIQELKEGISLSNKFIKSNLLRNMYISTPLLNYVTEEDNRNYMKSLPTNLIPTINENRLANSPRYISLYECSINVMFRLSNPSEENPIKSYVEEVFRLYNLANKKHISSPILLDDYIKFNSSTFKEPLIEEIHFLSNPTFIDKAKVGIVNTPLKTANFKKSLMGKPNLSKNRQQAVSNILKASRFEKPNIVLFPECYIPIQFLFRLVNFSRKNDIFLTTGLEHIIVKNVVYNYIVNIVPIKINGTYEAILIPRIKNHYAPSEIKDIEDQNKTTPPLLDHQYHIINWKNIYSTAFYCFELTDIFHRSLFKSKIDLLIAVEWNPDIPYFSNLVESTSRDLHCYVAQVNNSEYGDSRITQPKKTVEKDILKISGGLNDVVLVGEINIADLRCFQYSSLNGIDNKNIFKPLPPSYSESDLLKRYRNQNVLS